ncbi:hypothetical protein F4679DRAFT_91654 [Xylaria curta]|nr:hypothetical protein F4679DRAFT_91654 [Xylaria curta]
MSDDGSAGSASDRFIPCKTNLSLGFRVECHLSSTFRGPPGSMIPRNPERGLDNDAFKDHFDWHCRRRGPFISFFSEWDRALRWRGTLINLGYRDIVVIAVWLDDLEVFNASDVARGLRCSKSWYENEYLLYGAIHAEEHRILAMFRGDGDPKRVKLSFKDSEFEVELPGDFIRSLGGLPANPNDITEAIKREVYSRTGDKTDFKFEYLLSSICGLI